MLRHPHVDLNSEGTPIVKGTRIPVHRLFYWHKKGITVETLVKRYSQLGWAKILDALSYAYDNLDLMEDELEKHRRLLAGEQTTTAEKS